MHSPFFIFLDLYVDSVLKTVFGEHVTWCHPELAAEASVTRIYTSFEMAPWPMIPSRHSSKWAYGYAGMRTINITRLVLMSGPSFRNPYAQTFWSLEWKRTYSKNLWDRSLFSQRWKSGQVKTSQFYFSQLTIAPMHPCNFICVRS